MITYRPKLRSLIKLIKENSSITNIDQQKEHFDLIAKEIVCLNYELKLLLIKISPSTWDVDVLDYFHV